MPIFKNLMGKSKCSAVSTSRRKTPKKKYKVLLKEELEQPSQKEKNHHRHHYQQKNRPKVVIEKKVKKKTKNPVVIGFFSKFMGCRKSPSSELMGETQTFTTSTKGEKNIGCSCGRRRI